MSREQLQEDERWRLAKRISESASFARSPRLSHLLLYVCEEHILGGDTRLTEHQIAANVFGRKGSFDPSADTIVRSHVLRLRQKLETYFKDEGTNETLRVSLPKGRYAPVFEDAHPRPVDPVDHRSNVVPPESLPSRQSIDPDRQRAVQRSLLVACITLSLLCVLLITVLVMNRPLLERGSILGHSPRHQLWKGLFGTSSTTMLVAADSGLVLLHGATRHNTTLSEYLGRDFRREIVDVTDMAPEAALSFANRRYTSFVDLEFVDRLSHLPEALKGSYSIRYARDININDLKSSNAILSGSQDANPWLELFEPQMNFVLHDDLANNIRGFANRNPNSGEQALYLCGPYEYGVLSYLPNLSGKGNVLIVEGTSVAGTQAISDLLFVDESLDAFLTKIGRTDGSLPHFEILLESRNFNGSSSRPEIVSYRLH